MNILNNFSFDRFLYSLQYMWKGMLCIFIVIAAIIGVIYLLNLASNRKAVRKDKKKDGN